MILDLGYYFSAAIALTIALIGAYFFVAPYAAMEGFGVTPVRGRWNPYPSAKAIRDIGAGILIGILTVDRSNQLLGLFLLVATIIPVTDALIVLKHGGPKVMKSGIYGITAGFMLITSGLLLFG
jgi:Domain of unknown function (DUF4267)